MLNTGISSKLRVWKPVLSPEDVEASKVALAQGIALMRAETGIERPLARDLIWWLMQEAAETWRRLPDRERSWMMHKVMWPELARPSEECRQVEVEQQNCIQGGHDEYGKRHTWQVEAHRPRYQLTDPTAVDRALVVYTWLRFVEAKNPRRTKWAFIAMAEGKGTARAAEQLGRRVGESAMHKLKRKVLCDIERGLNKSIEPARKFL